MKNNRKCNSINKAEKLARKYLLTYISAIAILLALLFLFLFLYVGTITKLGIIGFIVSQLPLSICTLITYVLLLIFLWFIEKPRCINRAYEKVCKDYSKKLAEELLVPGKPVKVVLSKTRIDVYPDFFKGLQQDNIAEFYAILGIVDDLISIHARFNADGKEILLDVISKDEFTTYCDVKEETL